MSTLTSSPPPGFVRSERGWIIALALLLVASGCAGTSRGEPLVLTEDLDLSLQAALDASIDSGGLPGAQAAVVFHDGTVWSGAVGEDITTETQFPIGSITKLFTATAILRMAERGELSLDDKVAVRLPDEEVDGRVTIRQVLSHTSGLVRDGEDENGPEHATSICAPGTCVSYSNVGYSLLGRVIEAVTDDTVARAYHTEILDQLSLSSTVLATQEEVLGPLAVGHDPGGVLEPADIAVRWTDPSGEVNVGSAGAIVSNARDVAVFAAGLFRGELLEPQTMTEMLDFDTYADLDGADKCGARGLGVLRQSAETEFGLAWGHNGIVNGFTAAVRYYPGHDIAIAVLVNSSGIGGGAQGTEQALASLLLADTAPIDPDHGRGRCVQDVYTIRPDGRELSNVTTDARLEWSVTWSPDSTRLMFAADDLYVIDKDGSSLEQVTDTPGIDGAASWSPDGNRIVFESERSGEPALYTAAADGSGVEFLVDGRLPSWSPRGDTIAYSRPRPGHDMDLWLINADRTNPRPLLIGDGDELWASWSPDASTIAFAVNGVLTIVDVTASTSTPIEVDLDVIGDPLLEFASWGPTGHIAFIAGSDIWTVRRDGTDPRKVGGSPGRDFRPTWSPDGELIAFIGSHWHQ